MAGIAPSPAAPAPSAPSAARLVWRRLRRNWLSVGALALIVLMAVAAALAGWVAPYEPDETDATAALAAPGLHHWLGTDIYGRDLLSTGLVLALAFGIPATIHHFAANRALPSHPNL